MNLRSLAAAPFLVLAVACSGSDATDSVPAPKSEPTAGDARGEAPSTDAKPPVGKSDETTDPKKTGPTPEAAPIAFDFAGSVNVTCRFSDLDVATICKLDATQLTANPNIPVGSTLTIDAMTVNPVAGYDSGLEVSSPGQNDCNAALDFDFVRKKGTLWMMTKSTSGGLFCAQRPGGVTVADFGGRFEAKATGKLKAADGTRRQVTVSLRLKVL